MRYAKVFATQGDTWIHGYMDTGIQGYRDRESAETIKAEEGCCTQTQHLSLDTYCWLLLPKRIIVRKNTVKINGHLISHRSTPMCSWNLSDLAAWLTPKIAKHSGFAYTQAILVLNFLIGSRGLVFLNLYNKDRGY